MSKMFDDQEHPYETFVETVQLSAATAELLSKLVDNHNSLVEDYHRSVARIDQLEKEIFNLKINSLQS